VLGLLLRLPYFAIYETESAAVQTAASPAVSQPECIDPPIGRDIEPILGGEHSLEPANAVIAS
jgi:hypothetical protein